MYDKNLDKYLSSEEYEKKLVTSHFIEPDRIRGKTQHSIILDDLAQFHSNQSESFPYFITPEEQRLIKNRRRNRRKHLKNQAFFKAKSKRERRKINNFSFSKRALK